ncbi:ABC transporter ATP-binding protein [Heyndrickxia sporothermodurans]|uniref:ABC transporter ATP-binding protein n=1 Tax=Heyndrickxia sporothermodurans TaxID=46224 RepID=UPI0013656D3E|nr:ABC transporter ATP-binding protein [Heyndrickxia sporothermodurans]
MVDNVSFNIKKGEIIGLLGPNGAGKTTTMRMILGLVSKNNGSILINDKEQSKYLETVLADVGGIIETPDFYPYLTGFENLKYYSDINHVKSNNEVMQGVLKLLGLEHAQNKKVSSYSLGMKQRLGIAQTLIHQPKLLILDEPMNGLDPNGIKELRDYLKTIAKEKEISILISSHLISEIEVLCDKAIVMKNGKIIESLNLNTTNKQHGINVTIEVDNPISASEIIRKFKEDSQPTINKLNSEIMLNFCKADIPLLLLNLLSNNINVYEVKYNKKSLEDRFIQAIGGKSVE